MDDIAVLVMDAIFVLFVDAAIVVLLVIDIWDKLQFEVE